MSDIPEVLIDLCEKYELRYPDPGERWTFETTSPEFDHDEYKQIKRTLEYATCRLRSASQIEDGYRWTYDVPEPVWPEPLGYVTSEPPEWVSAQSGWKNYSKRFYGKVRGSIPDPGDCDRHPELPPDSYALTSVKIAGPEVAGASHTWHDVYAQGEGWLVELSYQQASGTSTKYVEVYSSLLGEFPIGKRYSSIRGNSRDTRRWIEFVDTKTQAREWVEQATGLSVEPDPYDRT